MPSLHPCHYTAHMIQSTLDKNYLNLLEIYLLSWELSQAEYLSTYFATKVP